MWGLSWSAPVIQNSYHIFRIITKMNKMNGKRANGKQQANRTNTRTANPQRANTPTFIQSTGGIRVKHREYIAGITRFNSGYQIYTTTGQQYETPLTMAINPGDGECFPWLSKIAPSFEHYTFNALKFSYVSSVSAFVQGAVAITPEYDPHGDKLGPPLSLAEMLNKEGTVKGNVWTNCSMNVPKKHTGTRRYVRAHHKTTLNSEHLRQTDLATLYVSLYNIGDADVTGAYGDLFVEYDITLSTPNSQSQSVKSLITTVGPQGLVGTIGGHAPIYSPSAHQSGVTGPTYYGGTHSTAGIRHDVLPVATTAGNAVTATRMHFDEPFHGKMIWRLDRHDGNVPSGIPQTARPGLVHEFPLLTYNAGKEPASLARATESFSHSSASAATSDWDFSAVWDIIAKAGDVLDFAFDTVGLIAADGGELTFTDMAIGLLDLALLA
jgi:hypothetical protein